MFRASVALLFLLSFACSPKPRVPSEGAAREAFGERVPRLTNLENAVDDAVRAAGLASAPTDETKRARAIAASQKEIASLIAPWDVACAAVTISTPSRGEELATRVASCPPSRRGDAVEHGAKVGEYDVGWGVYSKSDAVFRQGISAKRTWKTGDATSTIEVWFFLDE
jgi:hypothetical protein